MRASGVLTCPRCGTETPWPSRCGCKAPPPKPNPAWLIEYFNGDNVTVGYVRDITTDDGPNVLMTKDPNKALRFESKEAGQAILDDHSFGHSFGSSQWRVADHVWIDGPSLNGAAK